MSAASHPLPAARLPLVRLWDESVPVGWRAATPAPEMLPLRQRVRVLGAPGSQLGRIVGRSRGEPIRYDVELDGPEGRRMLNLVRDALRPVPEVRS